MDFVWNITQAPHTIQNKQVKWFVARFCSSSIEKNARAELTGLNGVAFSEVLCMLQLLLNRFRSCTAWNERQKSVTIEFDWKHSIEIYFWKINEWTHRYSVLWLLLLVKMMVALKRVVETVSILSVCVEPLLDAVKCELVFGVYLRLIFSIRRINILYQKY